jgi:hypothetical protein
VLFQGSADSNYSQPSSDLSLDEEKETLRREKERQALTQLEKARVSRWREILKLIIMGYLRVSKIERVIFFLVEAGVNKLGKTFNLIVA